jgi:hypothetical protein
MFAFGSLVYRHDFAVLQLLSISVKKSYCLVSKKLDPFRRQKLFPYLQLLT